LRGGGTGTDRRRGARGEGDSDSPHHQLEPRCRFTTRAPSSNPATPSAASPLDAGAGLCLRQK
jgi:hypothetical protein